MLWSLSVLVLSLACAASVKEVQQVEGDLLLGLMLHQCPDSVQTPFVRQSLISSAIWTVKRINFLQEEESGKFGLKAFEVCTEADEVSVILSLYQTQKLVGLISDKKLNSRSKKIADVLEVQVEETCQHLAPLIRAGVLLVRLLNWKNVVVVGSNFKVLERFAKISREEWLCVKEFVKIEEYVYNNSSNLIVFGNHTEIATLLKAANWSEAKLVLLPLDGSIITDLPAGSLAVVPPHTPLTLNYKKSTFFTTPLLFEVATPLLSFSENIRALIEANCNSTSYKVNCFRTLAKMYKVLNLQAEDVVELLKIEPLKPNFFYNIYKSENDTLPYTKIVQYNFFDQNLTLSSEINATEEDYCVNYECLSTQCRNFQFGTVTPQSSWFEIRTESWIFAFLALALLGVLLCIAILIFLVVAICRQDILEGSPVMTIALLLSVISIYCSIIPLALRAPEDQICLARSLSITLTFSLTFALILSRSILLATSGKELGFMSHLAGPVQAFLCLFIFTVQVALGLQFVNHCTNLEHVSILYFLSYNLTLLLLQLCLSPLIYRNERNYREGKYFTICTILLVVLWSVWVPGFVFYRDEQVQDAILCFGVISTATVVIGSVFIPRTYLMTVSAARDKAVSGGPSLATTASGLDIYRSGTQPVYDCVNVAALGLNSAYMDEEDFDFNCEEVSNDKMTRF